MTLLRITPVKFQQEAESNRLHMAREVEIPYKFWMAEGLKSLAKLTNLEWLDLRFSNCKISDSGASELKDLQKLQFLNIYDSSVTDRSLSEVFIHLPSLQTLELNRVASNKIWTRERRATIQALSTSRDSIFC